MLFGVSGLLLLLLLSQKGGSGDVALSAALDAIVGSVHDAPPKDNVIDYAERAIKTSKPPPARPEKYRPLDPVLRNSKDYPQVAKGDAVVSKLEDDLKNMVKSIREVVQ